jgi:hypothetical protein
MKTIKRLCRAVIRLFKNGPEQLYFQNFGRGTGPRYF